MLSLVETLATILTGDAYASNGYIYTGGNKNKERHKSEFIKVLQDVIKILRDDVSKRHDGNDFILGPKMPRKSHRQSSKKTQLKTTTFQKMVKYFNHKKYL